MGDKVIRAFIASASDCQELREASARVFSTLNSQFNKRNIFLHQYMWEKDKIAGYLEDPQKYQQDIFEEAKLKDNCEIFSIIFWSKLGVGTKQEYEFFKNITSKQEKPVRFLSCHYGKDIPHSVLQEHKTYYDLIDFIKSEEAHWAVLGNVRGSIKTITDFEIAFTDQITDYIMSTYFNPNF